VTEIDFRVTADDIDEIRPLIAQSSFKSHRHLGYPDPAMVALTISEIEHALRSPATTGMAIRAEGATRAVAVIEPLPWESSILNRRMAVLRHLFATTAEFAESIVKKAVRLASAQNIEFCLAKVHTDDHAAIAALQRNGFLLVETALEYVFDYRTGPFLEGRPDAPAIRNAVSDDMEAMAELSREAFAAHVGRFHADPHLSASAATAIYEEWARSALRGYADNVLVAEEGGRLAGFSAWKDPSSREVAAGIRAAHYSIGAVAPDFARRGVFRALTLAGMQRYRATADVVDGPTNLRNLAVQRAYEKLGWELRDSRHSFHLWL
jgi:ribosomal protein S18 acetylase RimI-like enzyme